MLRFGRTYLGRFYSLFSSRFSSDNRSSAVRAVLLHSKLEETEVFLSTKILLFELQGRS